MQSKRISKTKNKAPLKVLFATTEAFPFAGTGGLGEVCGSLPKALNAAGADARIIMPLYEQVVQKFGDKLEYIGNIHLWLGWRNQYCGLFSIKNDGVITYFIDNEYYFKRAGIYGYGDDGERFAFFARAVLEVLPMLGFKPDVINANDHGTALIPVYYKTWYSMSEGYIGIKTVFTIHNLEYQGCYPSHILGDVLGFDESVRGILDFNWQINFVKGAIETADIVSTVSPTYSREILVPERSFGLSDILQRNKHKLVGILNGINVDEYDPEHSPFIAKNYSVKDASGKKACKTALKKELGLGSSDKPLIAIISRLAGHKGFDLVREDLCRNENAFSDADLVVLGTGEKYLEDFFMYQSNTRDNVRTLITFDKALAQRIYAGADMFLMPSASEPCGLSQMMAARYGTVPIVRKTGGLADSIRDCRGGEGNGFTFVDFTADELDRTVKEAIKMYKDKAAWKKVVDCAMTDDFSWAASAEKYLDMYSSLL